MAGIAPAGVPRERSEMIAPGLGVGASLSVRAQQGVWHDVEAKVSHFTSPGPTPLRLESAPPREFVFEGILTMRFPQGWAEEREADPRETRPPLHIQLWINRKGDLGPSEGGASARAIAPLRKASILLLATDRRR